MCSFFKPHKKAYIFTLTYTSPNRVIQIKINFWQDLHRKRVYWNLKEMKFGIYERKKKKEHKEGAKKLDGRKNR